MSHQNRANEVVAELSRICPDSLQKAYLYGSLFVERWYDMSGWSFRKDGKEFSQLSVGNHVHDDDPNWEVAYRLLGLNTKPLVSALEKLEEKYAPAIGDDNTNLGEIAEIAHFALKKFNDRLAAL